MTAPSSADAQAILAELLDLRGTCTDPDNWGDVWDRARALLAEHSARRERGEP